MKKLVCLGFFFLLATINLNGQNRVSVEANMGPVIGDETKYHSINFQANANYLWGISQNIYLGLTMGGSIFWGEGKNPGWFGSIPAVYFPFGMAGRLNPTDFLKIGGDLGYAFSLDDTNGLYYRPLISYQATPRLSLLLAYSNIVGDDGETFTEESFIVSAITIGVNISL
ncbi:hypothetical protein NE848_10870 [Gramella jeungdoensis]|uniref:Outer membrane protein beta-barrel domain-containing protein n=1 Tax=Gramella jeungdoensis TaxID=708091 RepID=A0ABT0Z2E3_9FLAO|nr:hypothetical protein [Gramella jeungdoensis]MCM8569884.1 hypothetical protein [Gramella jeungdoensis]